MKNNLCLFFWGLSLSLTFYGCSHASRLAGKKTRAQQFEKKINDAGPGETVQSEALLKAAAGTLSSGLDISLPYSETGYFSASRANAAAFRFIAKRGEKLKIVVSKKPAENAAMYIDLWQSFPSAEVKPKFIMSADPINFAIEHVVTGDSTFIVRIQPELSTDVEYTLTITTGPSLAFPISSKIKSSIGSFFGVGRDKGDRKHEGIDIFAPVHSPAIAAANGIVTRVNENALGGKVVFMKPDNSAYTLYYAHLDSQIAREGQRVKTGDILGLTGNTGNAKFTASHLHFGVYANNSAIDPLYFVKPADKQPAKLAVPLNNLGTWMRTGKSARLYAGQGATRNDYTLPGLNTLIWIDAGAGAYYRVILPDGTKGFISALEVTSVSKPLKKLVIKKSLEIFSTPDPSGQYKTTLPAGDKINILAYFKDFYFISDMKNEEGWISKKQL